MQNLFFFAGWGGGGAVGGKQGVLWEWESSELCISMLVLLHPGHV